MSLFFSFTYLLCDQFVALEISNYLDVTACLSTINMVFSNKDKILISLYFSGYTGKRLTDEFSEISWTKRDVNKLLKKLRDTGTVVTVDSRPGSSRPHSACTKENIETVNHLVLSQEDKPQIHTSVREISWEAGIHRSSVSRIICKDLCLKCLKRSCAQELTDANCAAGMKRAKLLLQKFPQSTTDCLLYR